MFMTSLRDARGFSLMELMVASVVMTIVLGSAVALTSQVQSGYRRQLEDTAAEQEARYAIDWIGKYIRGAANNPAASASTECPVAGDVIPVQFDPNGDGENNDIRLMTDANPPDGLFGGSVATGGCNQSNEDVTISLGVDDPLTDIDESTTVTFLDNNTGGAVSTRTDTVIDNLQFKFRRSDHSEITDFTPLNIQAQVVYIETIITIRTRTIDAATGLPETRTLSQEIKIRSRG